LASLCEIDIYLTLQCNFVMQMKSFTHRVVPKISMEELILSSALRERLDAVINFEKARAVLLGQWGFEQERLGTACLFWGPHGTGKSAAAEAVGFELGRPLKVRLQCTIQLLNVELILSN
jgi:AAA+ superfamily predicted ATPase